MFWAGGDLHVSGAILGSHQLAPGAFQNLVMGGRGIFFTDDLLGVGGPGDVGSNGTDTFFHVTGAATPTGIVGVDTGPVHRAVFAGDIATSGSISAKGGQILWSNNIPGVIPNSAPASSRVGGHSHPRPVMHQQVIIPTLLQEGLNAGSTVDLDKIDVRDAGGDVGECFGGVEYLVLVRGTAGSIDEERIMFRALCTAKADNTAHAISVTETNTGDAELNQLDLQFISAGGNDAKLQLKNNGPTLASSKKFKITVFASKMVTLDR